MPTAIFSDVALVIDVGVVAVVVVLVVLARGVGGGCRGRGCWGCVGRMEKTMFSIVFNIM